MNSYPQYELCCLLTLNLEGDKVSMLILTYPEKNLRKIKYGRLQ